MNNERSLLVNNQLDNDIKNCILSKKWEKMESHKKQHINADTI